MEYYSENESEEMYLKEVFVLGIKKPDLRAVDICVNMGYAKSSVSRGVNKLKDKGLVNIEDNIITLTEEGKILAAHLYQKYIVLYNMFETIGLNSEDSHQLACKMEHIFTDEMFESLKKALYKHCSEHMKSEDIEKKETYMYL